MGVIWEHVRATAVPRARWEARPILGRAVRTVAIAVPLAVSMAAGIATSRLLDEPSGAPATIAWLLAIILVTVATLLVVERAARRLMPLGMLLQLSLAFPDQAPSRLRVALQAGSARRLAGCLERIVEDQEGDPETIVTLAAALNAHDRRTRGHSERVRALTEIIGQELGLSDADRERLRWAAFLHDIGKISVPSGVLNKPGELDRREWHLVRTHPHLGEQYASALEPWLGEWLHAIGHHHEHWDGTGYPNGLAGEDISYGGRIVAVTDAFETMTALRSYNRPMTPEQARVELTQCAGHHFDPKVVRAFVNLSISRVRWTVGLAAWVAQIPFLGVPARAGAQVVTSAAAVEGTAGSVVAAMTTVAAGVATPLTPAIAALSLDHFEPPTPVTATAVPVDVLAASVLAPPEVQLMVERVPADVLDPTVSDSPPSRSGEAEDPDGADPSPPLPEIGIHLGWTTGNHIGWSNGNGKRNGDPPHGFGL